MGPLETLWVCDGSDWAGPQGCLESRGQPMLAAYGAKQGTSLQPITGPGRILHLLMFFQHPEGLNRHLSPHVQMADGDCKGWEGACPGQGAYAAKAGLELTCM